MAVHERQQPPVGHGEVLCDPPFEGWAQRAEENRRLVAEWPEWLRDLRASARAQTLARAEQYSAGLHVETALPTDREALLIVTGHQPELYHPGVWVKDFLVQRFVDENGAAGLDVVVDTDEAGRVEMATPCLAPEVRVCHTLVAEGAPSAAYVQVPVPSEDARAGLREKGLCSLGSLRAPALARHFSNFCDALDEASSYTSDLASCMTAARRIYERPARTDYLELPVSAQCAMPAYHTFAATLLLDAARFRDVMNEALGDYRRRTGTRSAAQPFPDLGESEGGRIDAPFWLLDDGTRRPVSVDALGRLFAGEDVVARIGTTLDEARTAIGELLLAPKALALTMFERLCVADVFVHGTGGGRYDRVTDAVIERYFGVRPPAFVVASMTMLLPLGAPLVRSEDVAALEQLLNRFTHNPDQVLEEVEFDTVEECALAEELAVQKRLLVEAIAQPGADRKALGLQIRETNERLVALLQPMVMELQDRLELLRAERDAASVLTDRTYPYCLWDPREVMDKVR